MSKALALPQSELALTGPIGSLDHYIQAVKSIPVLSSEEESLLATRFREHGDLDAARQLVLSHLRFVVHIARGYSGYGLQFGDLIQEGNVGLMKAVKRFDPAVGVRLVSFAVHWIRAEIHEFILRNWRMVKVATTKAQRKLFFNLRRMKKNLSWLSADEARAVADELGVSPAEVVEMEKRLSGRDLSFDPAPGADEDDTVYTPAAYLSGPEPDPAIEIENEQWSDRSASNLSLALDELDDRSRDIVSRRWLTDDKATLHELADEYSVSAERIRQIEVAAMKKLRTLMAPSQA